MKPATCIKDISSQIIFNLKTEINLKFGKEKCWTFSDYIDVLGKNLSESC